MNRIAIALAAPAFASAAHAQQQAQNLSPGIVCGQLRAGDTAQILALMSEIDRLNNEVKALKAEAAKLEKK